MGDGCAKAAAARPSLSLSVEAAHSISYIVGEHVVARDEIEGGKRIRHESFALEPGQAARFELIDESGHRMVALWVTNEPGPSRIEPPKPLQIVASLGKHRSGPISVLGREQTMIAGRTRHPRRGLTVVAVLMCLIVLTLIGAALLKLGLVRRQINRDVELRLQAEWLVESGVSRALARAAESDYKGETWRLSAADLGLPERSEQINAQEKSRVDAAIVTIAVDQPGTETAPPPHPRAGRISLERGASFALLARTSYRP